ncbi:hypothetical protein AC579_2946 [Pseudocercospora musae]|uniref:Zn(2)-C6 fungal-type domain-containing protein n=1 Tax=Pseudocercospora musae TaxID=113226 RepID=A0A139IFF0_9PEZI|nr:hypothetical protein AC579_2946 [Pseudocercospora musae]KXT13366.1 hypothetical protein AC579_2946 [Pseudocercospora musae]
MSIDRTYKATPPSAVRTVPAKRRNGKLQSCEPCRKRKLGCDHRIPSCSRCLRRGHPQSCYYHPAPMTKQSDAMLLTPSASSLSSPDATTTSVTLATITTAASQHILTLPTPKPLQNQHSATRAESDPPSGRVQEILSVPSAGILMESACAPRTVGYLGEITSAAVVAEVNSSLGIPAHHGLIEPPKDSLTEDCVRNGVEVLEFLQDIEKIRDLLSRWFQFGDGFMLYRPLYEIWLEGLAPVLVDYSNGKGLESLAAAIWCNTQRSLTCSKNTTLQEWASAATGDQLRWETIGLLLSIIGLLSASLPPWDTVFKASYDRNELMHTTLKLVEICIDLSERSGARNELLLCLLYERTVMISGIQGDFSSEVWESYSGVCDVAILLGLHLDGRANSQTPFFLAELRARVFNVMFSMDKFQGTFLGRPPRLSYRYCNVPFPKDITDAEMALPWPELQARLVQLDANGGWSTSGSVGRSGWRRAWSTRLELREDVLEVVIGTRNIDLEASITSIRAREKQASDSLPPFCRGLDPEDLLARLKRDPTHHIPGRGVEWRPVDLLCFLSMHFGIRHTDFLLERAIFNKTKCDSSRMIASAKAVLNLVLKAHQIRDFLYEFQLDFTDMLAFYAVPVAGALAIEMLKRDQSNDPCDTFPRSETLQQLSVLVPALEAVRPDEGNYKLCTMGLNAIRKVLDQLLSKPPGRSIPIDGHQGHAFEDPQFGIGIGNDADFLQWLGNVDFDTNGWEDPL